MILRSPEYTPESIYYLRGTIGFRASGSSSGPTVDTKNPALPEVPYTLGIMGLGFRV